MAAKGGSRQQKQAAKAVRRRQAAAVKQQAERRASSLSGRVAAAAASPIERCMRTASMFEGGIGHVVLARRLPSGLLGCAFLLVDLFCLGAKDVYLRDLPPSDFDDYLETVAKSGEKMIAFDPASAKKLILGAVAFAADSGIVPARDYRTVMKMFDGIDAAASGETFTFGHEGRPLYVPGPKDTPARMREIERALARTRGEAWDIDPIAGLQAMTQAAMYGVLDLIDRRRAEGGGPVIEHEGATEADEDVVMPDVRPPNG